MNSLFSARRLRLSTILVPLAILMGCGEGDGQARIQNSPALPYAGPPDSCFEVLDFEDICGISYDFAEFEGGPGVIVPVADEPLIAEDAGNTSDKVIKAIKARATSGAVFGGFVMNVEGSPAPFTFAPGTTVSMKVWSQRQVNLLVEPEGGGAGSGDEVTHSGTGWEELTFTFPSFSGTTNGFVFIFDLGTNGDFGNDPDNWTFFIDDISVPEGGDGGPGPSGGFPITFDEVSPPAVTEFGGAGYAIEPGPTGGDGNSLKIVRDGGDNFAGAFVTVPEIPDDQGEQTISAFVYSPTADVPMVVKAEYGENMGTGDVSANEAVVVGWQTLTWTFTNLEAGNAYNRFVILPNLGTVDTGQSYYFDNIDLVGDGGGGGDGGDGALVTFDEATPPAVTEFGGAGFAIEPGPAGGGDGNTLKIVRDGGDVFAGAFVAVSGIPSDAGTQTISAEVYSPTAGIPMIVKLEFGENMGTGDVQANETVVVGWQTLTWTFTNLEAGNDYNRFVILPNLGTVDTGQSYYFDNIDLVGDGGGSGGGGATSTDFESGSATFADFEGGIATVIDNPDASGINTSTKVAQMQKFAGQSFGGSTLDLGGSVPLASGDSYTIKVRASRSVVVTLKLEPQGDENTATHSGSGTWEELCFDFAGISGDVTGLTLIFDNGTVGDAANDPDNWTFEFDDIAQTSSACPTGGGGGGVTTLPVDFEGDINSYDFGPEGGFEGGAASVVTNPDQGGINTSAQVGQMQKFDGAVFGGATLAIEPTTVTAGSSFTMKVWSQRAVPVLLQPEPQGPGSGIEVAHGGTGWEELTFSLPGLSGEVSGITIIFDNGTAGAAATDPDNWTFYFDDITLVPGGGGGEIAFPITFDEATPPAVTEFGGAGFAIEPGPAGGDGNALKIVRDGGDVFAGAFVVVPEIPNDQGAQTISAFVYSPTAGIPMIAKAEYGDNMGTGDVSANEAVVVGWQTLTWTFTNLAPGNVYNRFTMLPNLGTVDTATNYYFDNIDLVGTGGGGGGGGAAALPVDFEADPASYDFGPDGGFEGGAASVVTNPDQGGINTSAQVGQMLKFDGAVFGGATLVIEPTTVTAGSSFTMKVWSQRAVPVLLQPEPQGPGSGIEVAHGGTGWEELTFSLPGLSGEVSGITIIFDNGTAGAAATDPDNWTFYFDDITLVPGGGGGEIAFPITFDEATPPAVTEFGGAGFAIEPGPAGGDGNALKIVRDGGDVFAGAFVVVPEIPNDQGAQTISAFVYSPTAGIPMIAKAEYGDNMGTGDVSANEAVVVGWQTLTWTFTNLAPGNVYNRFTMLPNLGTVDTATNYYFDNIDLVGTGGGGGGSGTVLATFDEATPPEVNEFGGAVATIEAGPAGGDGNALKILRDGGEVWAGGWFAISGIPNDAGTLTLSALVYSPTAGIPMVAKLEYAENMGTGEVSANETVVVGWQTLTWTFTNLVPPNDYNRFVILPNLGTVDTATSYYIDNITLVGGGDGGGGGGGGGGAATTLPVDFEGDINSYDFGPFGGFEGGAASVVPNPDQGGINTSTQVGQMLKFDGAVFGGATLVIEPTEVTAGSSFTMKVWSQRAVPVLLQPEPQGPGSGIEVAHGGTGWEELTFSLPGLSGEVSGITIIFDNGTAGAAATDPTNWTFYFDDITLVPPDGGGGGGDGTVLVTFDEATPPTVTEFGGAGFSIEPGPAGGGDGNALRIIRGGGEVFAGAWVAISGIPNDTGAQTISAEVFSPAAGIPMVTKLEFSDNMGTGEVSANETVVAGWQTLTWTYTNLAPPNDYNRFVILPNLGAVDSATSYYFDNVTLVGDGGGGGGGGAGDIAVNGGFESGDFTGWTQFESVPGNQTVNMGMAGDTSSEGSFHLEINNTATETNSLIKQERVGLGSVTPGVAWTVTFDARGSLDSGGVAFAQVFSETATGNEDCTGCGILGNAPLAINSDSTVWTSFSFAGTAGPNTESLTLQLEAITGAGSLANMFYDNITIVIDGGGG